MNFNPNLIDEIFEPWNHPDTPGCVVGVMQSGELVYARGFGCANLDHDIPLSPNSVLDIGSTSKQFTAACIALLVLDGSLKLEDEIHHWLPEMPDYGTPITVRDLVYHSSGLRDHSMIAILGGLTIEDYQDNQTALEIAYRQHGLNFPPGSLHGYTNTNYLLLAEIVKRVSGKSLRRFADESIFQPLEMTATRFDDDGYEVMKGRAVSYRSKEPGVFLRFLRNNHEVGPTNLWTSLEDLKRWENQFIHPRLGGQKFVDLMLAPGRLADGKELPYAFGLLLGQQHGLKTVSHAGQWGGFRTELLRFPNQELAVVVLANLETILPTRLAYQVAELCLGEALPVKVPASNPAQGKTTTVPPPLLLSMAGLYHHPQSGEVTELFVQNDCLHANLNGRIFRLGVQQVNEQQVEFQVLEVPLTIRLLFTRQADGWHILRIFPGVGEHEFVPVEFKNQDVSALAEYGGEYCHPDLLTNWKVFVQEGTLQVVYGRAEKDTLKPAGKDAFRAPNIHLQFRRNEAGKVNSLLFDTERVRNISLQRCGETA